MSSPLDEHQIPLTPGFRRVSEDWVRSRLDTAAVSFWEVENRRTGRVDVVIGPCTFDEMVRAMRVLEGQIEFEARETRR